MDKVSMNTETKNAVNASADDAQYDAGAKRLLGNKYILAYILINIVEEFRGMSPVDVIPYIEGDPYIDIVPAEPGLTNLTGREPGQRIVGLNSESTEINEGLVRFDVVFYACTPSANSSKGKASQIIINAEAQKDAPKGYKILNRAVFYVSRLISSQKERDFTNQNYDDIKRVFSVWICMNAKENSMAHVHLTKDKIFGSHDWNGRLDLINIVLIGLANELPEQSEPYRLHRLLGALLSKQLSVEEKLAIMENEYHIPIEDEIRKDVNAMCNLSQGIKEDGIAIGQKQVRTRVIINMHQKGYSLEQIVDIAETSLEEANAVIERIYIG